MKNSELKNKLIYEANAFGLQLIRVIPAEKVDFWDDAIINRKNIDPDTNLYWEKRSLTSDPLIIMPQAKTIIIAVYPYNQAEDSFKKGYGQFSDHYYYYNKGHEAADSIKNILSDSGYTAIVDPPLPVKAIAFISGIGFFGKNGLIHNDVYGSWMTIHTILTDAIMPYDKPNKGEGFSDCGQCVSCIKSCPTGAIGDNGTIVLSKCLRYYMLSNDIIPIDIREKLDRRILGCLSCQICCPKNLSATYETNRETDELYKILDISSILSDHKKGLKPRMSELGRVFGRNYARAQRVLSMAVIAAGNSEDITLIPLLKETLIHPHVPIRAHSAWALGKIGGMDAVKALKDALTDEKNSKVRDEIQHAISNQ